MSEGMKRARRSSAQWQRLIAEQADSDLTQSAFCRARGISPSSLKYWKRRLAGLAASTVDVAGPGFVELTAAVADDAVAGGHSWDVELDLGTGMVLRLRRR
jgi:putative transposase